MFVALWSMSESPLEVREHFWAAIGQPQYILIGYQYNFYLLNNQEYFNEVQNRMPNYKWKTIKIEHLPHDYYLIGEKINP